MYSWGKASLGRIATVHPALQWLAHAIIQVTEIDITAPWMGGLRTPAEQNEIYKAGNSKCDGYSVQSYHQSGQALDIVPYNGKPDYKDVEGFKYLNELIKAVWQSSPYVGEYKLIWGGDWQDFYDPAHYEIRHTK